MGQQRDGLLAVAVEPLGAGEPLQVAALAVDAVQQAEPVGEAGRRRCLRASERLGAWKTRASGGLRAASWWSKSYSG